MKAKRMISMYLRNNGKELKTLVDGLLEGRFAEDCEKLALTTTDKADLYDLAEETIKEAAPQWSGYAEVNFRSLLRMEVSEAIGTDMVRRLNLKRFETYFQVV